MKPRIQMGLIVGVIGLVLNACVSGFIGLCGPFFTLLAGGLAGFLAAQREALPTKSDGAKAGATAGGIAGAFMIVGQLIGGIAALAIIQATGAPTVFGQVPAAGGPESVGYYLGGIGTGICFGIIGAALAAGAGAGAGYMATNEQPQAPATPPM